MSPLLMMKAPVQGCGCDKIRSWSCGFLPLHDFYNFGIYLTGGATQAMRKPK